MKFRRSAIDHNCSVCSISDECSIFVFTFPRPDHVRRMRYSLGVFVSNDYDVLLLSLRAAAKFLSRKGWIPVVSDIEIDYEKRELKKTKKIKQL